MFVWEGRWGSIALGPGTGTGGSDCKEELVMGEAEVDASCAVFRG